MSDLNVKPQQPSDPYQSDKTVKDSPSNGVPTPSVVVPNFDKPKD